MESEGRCMGIGKHERWFGELLTGQRHLEDEQEKISARLDRLERLIYWLGWAAAITLGGVGLQLLLLLLELKK